MRNYLYLNLIDNVYGHKAYDAHFIQKLSKYGNVFYLAPMNWYQFNEENRRITCIPFTYATNSGNRINVLKSLIKKIGIIKRSNQKYKFDTIIISTFYVKALPTILNLSRLDYRRIVLIHHNTIDSIDANEIQRKCFEKYKNNLRHIVFEDFISEHIICELGVNEKNVFAVPHPISGKRTLYKEGLFKCVGLSGSNDERIIEIIILEETKHGVFKKHGAHLLIKSQCYEFDNGFLKVVKGKLSDEDYINALESAEFVYIPFPDKYKYRVSGVFFEAILNFKRVIASDFLLANVYSNKYPGLVTIVHTCDDIMNALCESRASNYEKQRDLFLQEHSEEVIEDRIAYLLNVNK